ncbi:hypothetical protein [Sporofaciens musculi]|uniref:hypothetical protein n=1 Tax=Sporofaciens musculi TaxID=2681861 RepID=UPI00259CD83A|nr:hypothetical protein [Sporofaciens musculi]
MQDLTFGEQVKIILSRKDMTIKELAKKVEARTGRKMSRQNLTQRLGRDNFQERDMRMIAEILGCPFQLNILDERVITENELQGEQKSQEALGKAEQAVEKETAKVVEEVAAGQEETQKEPVAITPEESAEKEKAEGNVKVHERDITIGELVDIHEELDALMEKTTGKPPMGKTPEEKLKENQKDDTKAQFEEIHKASSDTSDGKEMTSVEAVRKDAKEEYPQEKLLDHSRGGTQGNVGEPIQKGAKEYPEEYPQGTLTGYKEDYVRENMPSHSEEYEEARWTGYPKDHETQDLTEGSDKEGIEGLLQETESLEKAEKKENVQEEKPHGWRAYLKQRLKKLGREQVRIEKEATDTGKEHSAAVQGPRAVESARPKDNYQESVYQEDGYIIDEYAGDIYTGEEHGKDEYLAGEYRDYHPEGEYPVETYGEDGREGDYSARAYVGGYSEMEYSDGTYEDRYLAAGYSEEAYQEEIPKEDEEDKGEVNPYTGKEYESNSVRMHPSRIGYVQVYDRANHEWTDMTEWAFLGYQERKKQLLGKDYDPPIYLD